MQLRCTLQAKLLRELKPVTIVVSHEFDMGAWKPQRVVRVQGPQSGEYMLYRDETCYTLVLAPRRQHTLYYWVIPEKNS